MGRRSRGENGRAVSFGCRCRLVWPAFKMRSVSLPTMGHMVGAVDIEDGSHCHHRGELVSLNLFHEFAHPKFTQAAYHAVSRAYHHTRRPNSRRSSRVHSTPRSVYAS